MTEPDGVGELPAGAVRASLARENAARAGAGNAEFLAGHIEDVPLPDGHVDVVISNCVINLSADKAAALAEAFRVLRPGGRLGLSDLIASDGLSPGQRAAAEQLTGCTTGTITASEYRDLLLRGGFTGIRITGPGGTEPGVHPAVIQAVRPAAPAGVLIRPMRPGSGRSRPASSPRTRPASGCTSRPGSAPSAPAARSAGITAAGAMS